MILTMKVISSGIKICGELNLKKKTQTIKKIQYNLRKSCCKLKQNRPWPIIAIRKENKLIGYDLSLP